MELVSLQKIDKIIPIEGADKIELCQVLGWQVVAGKGQFKEGQTILYVQPDSLVPYFPEVAFLERSSNFKEYGVEYGTEVKPGVKYSRLKNAKFKGQISQGLLLDPKDFAKEHPFKNEDLTEIIMGEFNWTNIVGVVKYNKPISASLCGSAKGGFPSYIHKTDEERVQNIVGQLNEFHGKEVYETLKIDGTSATYFYNKDTGEFGVCSRNMRMLEDGDSLYTRIAKRYNIKESLIKFCEETEMSIAIQGEIAGPKIQNNPLNLKEQILFLFTVQEIFPDTPTSPVYLNYNFLTRFAEISEIYTVPILGVYKFDKNIHTSKLLVDSAMELKYPNGSHAEGKVIRWTDEQGKPPRGLGRWSFKAINNNYKD